MPFVAAAYNPNTGVDHSRGAMAAILSFTDTFGIDSRAFEATGAFDPVIGIDSRLFIDPALLEQCRAPEFTDARDRVEKYFGVIIELLSRSRAKGDANWKRADRLLTFSEIRGTCLGYCAEGNTGAGIGPRFRDDILESVSTLIDIGVSNPTIFELLGVFESGVGADRISDLVTFILRETIARHTERVARQAGYTSRTLAYEGHLVPKRPGRNEPILLLPKDILSPLPIAMGMGDIDYVCSVNERVRSVVNEYFPWDEERRSPSKEQIKELMLGHPDFAMAIIEAYEGVPRRPYDFGRDAKSETSWYLAGRRLAADNPLPVEDAIMASPILVARAICAQFKHAVECNGAWKLLYDAQGTKPRPEKYSQKLFHVVASAYCDAYDIDISPEPDSGNGPVDFKLSHGKGGKCIVELKMSSSKQLHHCIDKQIPAYMEAEGSNHAIYLLVQTGNDKRVDELIQYYQDFPQTVRESIELMIVDARPKESASRR